MLNSLKAAIFAMVLFGASGAFAQDVITPVVSSGDPHVSLKIDTRFDGELTTYGKDDAGNRPDTKAGYDCAYLNLIISGKINEHFSYSFRQRFNKDNGTSNKFTSSTDWANLTYAPDDKWSITGGKQIVLVGGMEYDYAPIDVYYYSTFWANVNPYQIGVNVGYNLDKNNQVLVQMTNSPFSTKTFDNLFAYNLMWYGKIAPWWSTTWSVNAQAYDKGRYINYIALGNRFSSGNVSLDLDWMNRYVGHGSKFFKDFSIISKLNVKVNNHFNIFVKGGYDQNKADSQDPNAYDHYVVPGTDRGFWGAGVEYFPLNTNRQKIRIHACWDSSSDKPSAQNFMIGLRWTMDVFNLRFK